ncbi:5770_t:CDS:2 [Cetraspora pellucida]|uniref:5770_t:CDS:1 n=1 Tax=Cetraspora pellucida TaxID=1433469 RepID=A0ACA9NRN4_9GLOM|nr:5770_t:CDS:2 [Cetraspora pellucida]
MGNNNSSNDETENCKKEIKFKEEIRKQEMKFNEEIRKQEMKFNEEIRKQDFTIKEKLIELENMKMDLDKRKFEIEIDVAKNKHELEKGKAIMEHQHKISELIMQIQQSKQQNGKDILQTYLGKVNDLIQKNIEIYQLLFPLLHQINDEKYERLPSDIKEAINESIKKNLQSHMSPKEILDYSKTLLKNLQFNNDQDLKQVLGAAVKQNLITEGEASYLLAED